MKRAFVDLSLELLGQLLGLKEDIQIVHVDQSPCGYGIVRLHLRGDGLAPQADQPEGAYAWMIEDIESIRNPATTEPSRN